MKKKLVLNFAVICMSVSLSSCDSEHSTHVVCDFPDEFFFTNQQRVTLYINEFIKVNDPGYDNTLPDYYFDIVSDNKSISQSKDAIYFDFFGDNPTRSSVNFILYNKEDEVVLTETFFVRVLSSTHVVCTLPDEFIVINGQRATLYINEFIKGNDTGYDNTLTDYYFDIVSDNKSISQSKDAIYFDFFGDNPLDCSVTFNLYNKENEVVLTKNFLVRVMADEELTETKSILMLGDSWTSINDSNTGEGYVYYVQRFFQDRKGIIPQFIGTRTTNSGICHEGRGGYTINHWISSTDNPLWNANTKKIDFNNYRKNLCGLDTPVDLVNIQLGVNESIRQGYLKSEDIDAFVKGYMKLIEAILEDSPDCKIIINLCGLDDGHLESWNNTYGDKYKKEIYQSNVYMQRLQLYEELSKRSDFGRSVFWGQSVLGLDRWNSYENATHPNMEGYKQLANTLGPQLLYVLQQ